MEGPSADDAQRRSLGAARRHAAPPTGSWQLQLVVVIHTVKLLVSPIVITIPSHLSCLQIQSRILRNQTKLTDSVTYYMPTSEFEAAEKIPSRSRAAARQSTGLLDHQFTDRCGESESLTRPRSPAGPTGFARRRFALGPTRAPSTTHDTHTPLRRQHNACYHFPLDASH